MKSRSKDLLDSEFELHLMPLAFVDLPTNMDSLLLNAEEKNFLSFLKALDKHYAKKVAAWRGNA